MYKIITSHDACPAGPDNIKRRLDDGTWEMDWCNGNGTVVTYADKTKAERDAKWLPTPTNGVTSARVEDVQ